MREAYFARLEAELREKALRSKHCGVHSAFGEHFVKAGLIETEYAKMLGHAFDSRLDSDKERGSRPDILAGKPVIAGTRVPVYLILNLLAAGYDVERIIQAYPGLTREDIQAALWYAEQRMRYEEVHPLAAAGMPA